MDATRTTGYADNTRSPKLATLLAAELRKARTQIVRRWLDRIVARVRIDQNAVFPTDELLDHVPLLVDGIASYIESCGAEVDQQIGVEAKAMELGALRHAQGFDAHQILKEHEILAGIIFTVLAESLGRIPADDAPPQDVALVWRRAAEAIDEVRQATMTHFLRVSAEQVRQREERLRRFNRMVSHELNPPDPDTPRTPESVNHPCHLEPQFGPTRSGHASHPGGSQANLGSQTAQLPKPVNHPCRPEPVNCPRPVNHPCRPGPLDYPKPVNHLCHPEPLVNIPSRLMAR